MDIELRKEYYQKAFKLHSAGNVVEALNFYKKIVTENPNDAEVLNLMGICYLQLKDLEQAEIFVVRAIESGRSSYFYETLAQIYHQRKDYKREIAILLQAEENFGISFEIAFHLGLAYKNIFEYQNAIKYYQNALVIKPDAREAYMNLANVYTIMHEFEQAKITYQKCLEIFPNDREAEYFLALIYFRFKDYEKGLPLFETRLCRETAIKTTEHTYPNLMGKSKLWEGEDISDKVLYAYYEAGFGDMLMFARYIPMLVKRCKKLILKPQVQLSQLFRENFPEIEVMDYFLEEDKFHFDVHIPFLSVPYVLGLSTDEMFISRKQYLQANDERVIDYRINYFDNEKFKIGIKWQGNTYYETDRVINVEAFSGLFELPNTQVYSAQTFEGAEEFEKLSAKYNIVDLSKSFKDFSYTAGAVENLDLIICNDTSLAHLAGAMNKPCAVLLPYNYNWRWHTDMTYCDWYESVKLYLLEQNDTWESVMQKIIADIKNGKL